MAGNIKHTPNLKKTHARNQKANEAITSKTTYLSEEFKETIRQVSGQSKSNERPVGHQEDVIDDLRASTAKTTTKP